MDALGGWLKQIIAVVLLASFVDLLLPNKTMQRYVRLVAGLFILLTVIGPLLGWLKGDVGSKLADGLNRVEQTPESAPEQLAMIEREGEKLRDRQGTQAAELAKGRLAEQIRADVASTEGRDVRSVDVKVGRGSDGAWAVSQVSIVLEEEAAAGANTAQAGNREDAAERESGQAEAAENDPDTRETANSGRNDETAQPIADIEPIAPVVVDIGSGAPAADEDAEPAFADADPVTERRIAALVAARYGIPAKAVEVVVANGGRNAAKS